MKSFKEIKENVVSWVKEHPTETVIAGCAGVAVTGLLVHSVRKNHALTVETEALGQEILDAFNSVDSAAKAANTSRNTMFLNTPTINDLYNSGAPWGEICEEIAKSIKNNAVDVGLPNLEVTDANLLDCNYSGVETGLTDVILNNIGLDDLGLVGEALKKSGTFDTDYMVSVCISQTLSKVTG